MALELSELLAPTVGALGLELVDVKQSGRTVQVVVDREGGVDLDTLTEATRAVSSRLDRDDPLPGGRYVLEVSSPGLERALATPAQFGRAVGETVTLKCIPESGFDRRLRGRLASVGADDVTLEGEELPDGRVVVPFGVIEKARTVFEWGSPPPGPKTGAAGRRRERTPS